VSADPARGAGEPFAHWGARLRARVEDALHARLPPAQAQPARLHEAMRYATLGGGKRVRALLVYAAAEAAGARVEHCDAAACAVELIHAYSLVHDDLPAMDDDELRRGKPTCHKAFDEATALLAGDALQSLAFEVLAHAGGAGRALEMVAALAAASGSRGMAGGQAIDLAAVGRDIGLPALEQMHRLKTGALIRASVRLGALAGAATAARDIEALERYAACVGLAFQIQDDILDVEGSTEVLGKTRGADAALAKPTFPSLLGLEASKRRAGELHEEALAALEPFAARAVRLRELAQFVIARAS